MTSLIRRFQYWRRQAWSYKPAAVSFYCAFHRPVVDRIVIRSARRFLSAGATRR
jgi:hypothetical protein